MRWKRTNELAKQFVKCFGIEPRYEDACTVEDKYWDNEELANEYGTFDQYMNCKCGDQENCTTECSSAYQREVYPQITDRILLELICIAHTLPVITFVSRDVKSLKEEVLMVLCNWVNNRSIKQQVQTLFEEK